MRQKQKSVNIGELEPSGDNVKTLLILPKKYKENLKTGKCHEQFTKSEYKRKIGLPI